jgi:hypothetical protein
VIAGRINRSIKGQAEKGLEDFYKGLDDLMIIVRDAITSDDPFIMTLVEYTIIAEELVSAGPEEVHGRSSYEEAMREFDDAFRCIPLVDDKELYKAVEKSYPTRSKYRYKKMPLDAYHAAYKSHKIRMNNNRRRIGIDSKELELQTLRDKLYIAAQECYRSKQADVLS